MFTDPAGAFSWSTTLNICFESEYLHCDRVWDILLWTFQMGHYLNDPRLELERLAHLTARNRWAGRIGRLFTVAVYRPRPDQPSLAPYYMDLLDVAELIADGERPPYRGTLVRAPVGFVSDTADPVHRNIVDVLRAVPWGGMQEYLEVMDRSKPDPFQVAYDLLGNPFRAGTNTRECTTPAVLDLVDSIYSSSVGLRCRICGGPRWTECAECSQRQLRSAYLEPSAFPILADALEEAGYVDPPVGPDLTAEDLQRTELLAHLRGPGPHFRGCWALDAIIADQCASRPSMYWRAFPRPLKIVTSYTGGSTRLLEEV